MGSQNRGTSITASKLFFPRPVEGDLFLVSNIFTIICDLSMPWHHSMLLTLLSSHSLPVLLENKTASPLNFLQPQFFPPISQLCDSKGWVKKASYSFYNSIWYLIRMISAWYSPTITLLFLQRKQELIILREPLCISVLFIAETWNGARHSQGLKRLHFLPLTAVVRTAKKEKKAAG